MHDQLIGKAVPLAERASVQVGPEGAVTYSSKVRPTGYVLSPGMPARITRVAGSFRVVTTGHARPPTCYLVAKGRPEACRTSHVHSFLVRARDLEVAP